MNVMTKCPPGCDCKRHKRVISDEHRANIAKANAARKGESHKCPEGCACKRHQAYYRGGSQKGRTLSEQAKKNIADAALSREYTDEDRQHLADQMAAQRADPAFEQKRIAAMKEALRSLGAQGPSKPESALAPYLAALGFAHNCDGAVHVGRKTPDFVDVAGHRVPEHGWDYPEGLRR